MGEIADMMLEGDLCEGCGVALDGEGYGIPRYCSDACARDRGYDGIQSDGAGVYRKSKKVKGKPLQCLSIRISYNGQPLSEDGKGNFKFHDLPKDQAKVVVDKIRKIIDGVKV